jgi:hypothetical protein
VDDFGLLAVAGDADLLVPTWFSSVSVSSLLLMRPCLPAYLSPAVNFGSDLFNLGDVQA